MLQHSTEQQSRTTTARGKKLMATKTVTPPEKLYECEVKRRRVRAGGGYEPFWKVKTVAEAVVDGDTEFRCKDCHGALKLAKRQSAEGTKAHVEHKSKTDAEYCAGSTVFKEAAHGSAPRLSANPVV